MDYTLPIDTFLQDNIIVLTRPMRWVPFVYDDISSFTLKVDLPYNYQAFSSGVITKNNNGSYITTNPLNSGFPLIITPKNYYKVTKRKIDNINILFYFHNNDTVLTNSIIEESIKTFKFCNNYIGDYNREQLTFIEFPGMFCQSMETFLMAGKTMIDYYKYPQMRYWVPHEIIHQWIGAGYFNTIEKDNELRQFIEESFTEYTRMIYIENEYGADSLKNEIKERIDIYNNEIKGTKQDITIMENKPMRVTYVVGPLFFHWLKNQIGDEKWKLFIQDLYRANYGKIITYQDFKVILNKYTSIKNIEKIENWTKRKGIQKKILGVVSP